MGLTEQPEPVDNLLRRKAVEMGVPVLGLESVDQQIDILFNSLSLERQAELLVETIKDSSMTSFKVEKLNNAYLAGDLSVLASLGNDDDWSPEEKHAMVDNRNLNWVKVLPDYLNRHACFIAVGCLHLVDETGLINQLRLLGYLVEPLNF